MGQERSERKRNGPNNQLGLELGYSSSNIEDMAGCDLGKENKTQENELGGTGSLGEEVSEIGGNGEAGFEGERDMEGGEDTEVGVGTRRMARHEKKKKTPI